MLLLVLQSLKATGDALAIQIFVDERIALPIDRFGLAARCISSANAVRFLHHVEWLLGGRVGINRHQDHAVLVVQHEEFFLLYIDRLDEAGEIHAAFANRWLPLRVQVLVRCFLARVLMLDLRLDV